MVLWSQGKPLQQSLGTKEKCYPNALMLYYTVLYWSNSDTAIRSNQGVGPPGFSGPLHVLTSLFWLLVCESCLLRVWSQSTDPVWHCSPQLQMDFEWLLQPSVSPRSEVMAYSNRASGPKHGQTRNTRVVAPDQVSRPYLQSLPWSLAPLLMFRHLFILWVDVFVSILSNCMVSLFNSESDHCVGLVSV